MHAAVGDQPDQMDAVGVRERLAENMVGRKFPALRGLVDSGQVLHDESRIGFRGRGGRDLSDDQTNTENAYERGLLHDSSP